MLTSSLQTLWVATVQQLSSATARVLTLQILATYRFTLHVSLYTATSSRSLLLCQSRCVTTAVSGYQRSLRMLRLCRQAPRRAATFLRKTATTTWSAAIRHSATSFRVTLLHVLPRSVATRASALTTPVSPYSSTSLSQSTVSASTLSVSVTATSSTCTRRSQTLILASSPTRLTA